MLNEESFGARYLERRKVALYTIRNPHGLSCQLTNYGAKIVTLNVPVDGESRDVVLGFNTLAEWMEKETYFNATIGRYANRIKDGRIEIDGVEYTLPQNNGGNCLHGGEHGFNEKIWEVVGQTAYSISFHYLCKDGEEGFPGNLDVYVTYQVTRDNELAITYEAKTDRATVCGFTNHAYFNLRGEGAPDVRDHVLQVCADRYTPFDDTSCPTGEILPVSGTPMDFTTPTKVGDRIDDPFFAPGRGIDNCWVLPHEAGEHKLLHAATVSAAGITMEVHTTMPGLQVYTGNWVEENIGKSGAKYGPQNSICLECQPIPDSMHHADFPGVILRPGEILHEQTVYKFV